MACRRRPAWPRPMSRAGASRREAGQHPAGKRSRAGRAHLFRPGPRGRRRVDDPLGDHPGHAAIHVARTGAGRTAGRCSDLFSLGCVLDDMATGVSPFRADSTMATLRRLIDDPPPALSSLNAEFPSWFVRIVERLLEKDRPGDSARPRKSASCWKVVWPTCSSPPACRCPRGFPRRAARPASRRRKILFKGTIAMVRSGNRSTGNALGQATRRRTLRATGRVKTGDRSCSPRFLAGRVRRQVHRNRGQGTGQDRTEMVADRAPLQRRLERGPGPLRRPFHPPGGSRDSRRVTTDPEVEDQSGHAASGRSGVDAGGNHDEHGEAAAGAPAARGSRRGG